jgi:murein DD-endopeptidase MepM/ murein hydrolase activator NlpD
VLAAAAVILIAAQAFFLPEKQDESSGNLSPSFRLFTSEKAYIDHVRKVSFDGLELRFATVKSGSNFWLIARDNGINIDTLISSNPFWQNLNARTSQTVVVPSRKGVLHFVDTFGQIDKVCEMYGADRKDVIVQKLPFHARFTRMFEKNPEPIAVFVNDVKPRSAMMQTSLAKNFEAREMFRSPLGGRFSSYFGRRLDPIVHTGQFHNGLDIATGMGTPVGAASGGVVEDTGWMGGYGKAVIINHQNGYKTLYGHLSAICTRPGAKVKPGTFIGRVGSTGWSTGPHLHFTVWHNGQLVNPMNLLW